MQASYDKLSAEHHVTKKHDEICVTTHIDEVVHSTFDGNHRRSDVRNDSSLLSFLMKNHQIGHLDIHVHTHTHTPQTINHTETKSTAALTVIVNLTKLCQSIRKTRHKKDAEV